MRLASKRIWTASIALLLGIVICLFAASSGAFLKKKDALRKSRADAFRVCAADAQCKGWAARCSSTFVTPRVCDQWFYKQEGTTGEQFTCHRIISWTKRKQRKPNEETVPNCFYPGWDEGPGPGG